MTMGLGGEGAYLRVLVAVEALLDLVLVHIAEGDHLGRTQDASLRGSGGSAAGWGRGGTRGGPHLAP